MQYVIEIIIGMALTAAVAFGVYKIIKRARHGSACCGEREKEVKRVSTRGKSKADYPYSVSLKIGGMTCQNCAKRVENALNSLDGVLAAVDLNSSIAKVRTKEPADVKILRGTVAKAGYTCELIQN